MPEGNFDLTGWPPDGYPPTFTELQKLVDASRPTELPLNNAITMLAVQSIMTPGINTQTWLDDKIKRTPQIKTITKLGITAEKLEERRLFLAQQYGNEIREYLLHEINDRVYDLNPEGIPLPSERYLKARLSVEMGHDLIPTQEEAVELAQSTFEFILLYKNQFESLFPGEEENWLKAKIEDAQKHLETYTSK